MDNHQIKLLASDLLSGKLHLDVFDRVCIRGITNDTRLNNIYDSKKFNSISEFLSLGKRRFSLRNYGKTTEYKLLEAIKVFLQKNELTSLLNDTTQNKKDIDKDLANQILEYDSPEKLINSSTWEKWMQWIIGHELEKENIFYICQEIGVAWPVKNGWEKKLIEDFSNIPFSSLLGIKNFGRAKFKSLIKAVAYLISCKREILDNKSIIEKIIWFKNIIQLSEQEREIYQRRIKDETLQEIGCSMGVTRERIRQKQKDVLFKYRSPLGLKICSDYLAERQDAIWSQISKGRSFILEKDISSMSSEDLAENDCFALFVYTGEKVKGERFNDFLSVFLDRRFNKAGEGWFNLQYDKSDVVAAIAILRSTIQRVKTPLSLKQLSKDLPNFSYELLLLACQLSKDLNLYYGYIVNGNVTPRIRRAIGVHVILGYMESSTSIIPTSLLTNNYRTFFSFDQCSARDIEIVMIDNPHLFFKLGQEGWVSIGVSTKLAVENSNPSCLDIVDVGSPQKSMHINQIAECLNETGICHISELREKLIYKEIEMPHGSLAAMLHIYEGFFKFAPGIFGLKKDYSDDIKIQTARLKIMQDKGLERIKNIQLKNYSFARYAGESRDVYALWGIEFESLYAQVLYDHADDPLVESFWSIVIPEDIAEDQDTLQKYKERKKFCRYRLSPDVPFIRDEERIDFDELLAALLYLKSKGRISCARSNILMGRRIDGLYSISLLTTLVLIGAISPEEDWQKAHYYKGELDSLIELLKNAYSKNQEINWSTGLGDILLPIIEPNIDTINSGWMCNVRKDDLRLHFFPENIGSIYNKITDSEEFELKFDEGVQI